MLKALLFSDIVDSTQWAQRVGDERAATLWAEHDRRARQALQDCNGLEIDRSDGFFLLFDSAADACRYAQQYHAALAGLELAARVGIHLGDVTLRHAAAEDIARGAKRTEVDGLAKPLAARIMSLARGGQTLLSAAAAAAAAADGVLHSHGHYRLKGIDEPVEIFEAGNADATPPADAEKAYRVLRVGELWQPAREVRHNLTPERDRFVGRGAEMRELAQALQGGTRLLTLLGPGGTGKTRLIRRYGLAWLGDWPGGVYFCDLSEARSLDGIHFAVAVALGVPLGKGDAGVQLGHVIAGRGRCLVILDNFEQLLPFAEDTVGRWMAAAGAAHFAVTSRERLQVTGEQVLAIEPLPLASDAVELFEVRARAQRPQFTLDASERQAVTEVVRLLDGLPLAIELAAARVRVLSPAQILHRLKDRFALLGQARGAAARQATLKAAIDWSWDLLLPWERAALAQCSVFEGGFTLEAAEGVIDLADWPDAPPVLDAVQALVDKSLLRAWMPKSRQRLEVDEPYFGMYLSIHDYAAEKLLALSEGTAQRTEQRHGAHYAAFGDEAFVATLARHGGVKRRQALALEVDNLAIACRRALQRADGRTAALSYRALWEVLQLQGPFGPGIELGPQVLALPGLPAALQIDTTFALAGALMRSGRVDAARQRLEPALQQAIEIGDRWREGRVLGQLGHLDREQGRMEAARQKVEAALVVQRETGHEHGQAQSLHTLGNLYDQQGASAESRRCHEAALEIFTRIGDRHGVAHARGGLGILNRHQGRMDEARENYAAALAMYREVGDRRSEGIVMGNLANLLTDQGHTAEAEANLVAALAIHREVGSRIVEGNVLANYGLLLKQLGRFDESRTMLEQALAIMRELSNTFHQGVVLSFLGALDLAQGRLADVRTRVDEARAFHQVSGNKVEIAIGCNLVAEASRQLGRADDAMQSLQEGEALLREIDNPFELANLLCTRARTCRDLGQADDARAAIDEALAIARQLQSTADSALLLEIEGLRAELAP